MKLLYISILLMLICTASLGGTRYAGDIFQIAPGVRNQAMGGTGLTKSSSLAAGWWNPALITYTTGVSRGAELMYSEHFEGLMRQNQASLILGNPGKEIARAQLSLDTGSGGRVTVVPDPNGNVVVTEPGSFYSIIVNHLSINRIKLTQLEDPTDSLSNDNRPEIWKTIGNNDVIFYGAIGRTINASMSLGIAPKLAYRSLAEHSGYAFGADLGFLYSKRGFRFGANLRDFFSSQVLWENGTYENVLPNLDLETSYRFWFGNVETPKVLDIALRSQVFADDRSEEGSINAGPISADLHAGLSFRPIYPLAIMAGYDVDAFTAGLGIDYHGMGLNYAFKANSPDGLGSTQKISLNYRW